MGFLLWMCFCLLLRSTIIVTQSRINPITRRSTRRTTTAPEMDRTWPALADWSTAATIWVTRRQNGSLPEQNWRMLRRGKKATGQEKKRGRKRKRRSMARIEKSTTVMKRNSAVGCRYTSWSFEITELACSFRHFEAYVCRGWCVLYLTNLLIFWLLYVSIQMNIPKPYTRSILHTSVSE